MRRGPFDANEGHAAGTPSRCSMAQLVSEASQSATRSRANYLHPPHLPHLLFSQEFPVIQPGFQIDFPDQEKSKPDSKSNSRKFLLYLALIPLLMLAGAWIGAKSHVFLSKAHPDVYLAELLISHPELKTDSKNIDIQTFLASGKSLETLVSEAQVIREKFHTGSMLLGAFLGLVIGLMAMNQVIFRRREDYQANKGNCYSCARCLDYCPVE